MEFLGGGVAWGEALIIPQNLSGIDHPVSERLIQVHANPGLKLCATLCI